MSINHYLIDYIIGLYNLEETSDWEDYTEYEYFKSKEDFNRACDAYKGSAEKCHNRYIEYMNN